MHGTILSVHKKRLFKCLTYLLCVNTTLTDISIETPTSRSHGTRRHTSFQGGGVLLKVWVGRGGGGGGGGATLKIT